MFGECTCASMLFLSPARTIHQIWDWIKKSQIQTAKLPHRILKLTCGSSWQRLNHFIPCYLSISISKVNPRCDGCVTDSVKGIFSQCIYIYIYQDIMLYTLNILQLYSSVVLRESWKTRRRTYLGFKKEANWGKKKQ